jgi:hypothetical protein
MALSVSSEDFKGFQRIMQGKGFCESPLEKLIFIIKRVEIQANIV